MQEIQKNTGFAIIPLIIIVVVLLAGAGSYAVLHNKKPHVEVVTDTSSDTPLVQNTNSNVSVSANTKLTKNWKSYTYGRYIFSYPSNWTPVSSERGMAFTVNGKNVATVTCPIREIGYPGSEIIKKRSVVNQDLGYTLELQEMKDTADGSGKEFSLIFINEDDFAGSCEISVFSGESNNTAIAEQIFLSIVVIDKADFSGPKEANESKRYTDESFGFSFYYPPNMSVSKKPGGIIVISDGQTNDQSNSVASIREVTGPSVSDSTGKFGQVVYYFKDGNWMMSTSNERDGGMNPETVVVSPMRTIGELPYFRGSIPSHGWGQYSYIVALSAEKFLIVTGRDNGDGEPTLSIVKSIYVSPEISQNTYRNDKYGFAFKYPAGWTAILSYETDDRVILSSGIANTTPINIIFGKSSEDPAVWAKGQRVINTYLGTVGDPTTNSLGSVGISGIESPYKFEATNTINDIPGIAFKKGEINFAILGQYDSIIGSIVSSIVVDSEN